MTKDYYVVFENHHGERSISPFDSEDDFAEYWKNPKLQKNYSIVAQGVNQREAERLASLQVLNPIRRDTITGPDGKIDDFLLEEQLERRAIMRRTLLGRE